MDCVFLTFLNVPQYSASTGPAKSTFQSLVERLDFPQFDIFGFKIDLKEWILNELLTTDSDLVEYPVCWL